MLLKLTEKIIRENVFDQKKKKLGLNLTFEQLGEFASTLLNLAVVFDYVICHLVICL